MSGAKHGTFTQILKEEERALYTHCYGHALNLAVGDSIRKSIMSDALDNCQEIPIFSSIHQKETLCFIRLKLKLLLNQLDFVFYAQLAGQLGETVFRVSTRIMRFCAHCGMNVSRP